MQHVQPDHATIVNKASPHSAPLTRQILSKAALSKSPTAATISTMPYAAMGR